MSLMDPCDALLHTLRATESWMFSVIWSVPYSVSSVGYLAAPREVPCLDDPSRSARNDKALVRWLARLFNHFLGLWALHGNRCTRAGAQFHSRGVWFEKQFTHPHCSRPSHVRFTAPVRLLAAPPRGGGINGLDLMSGLVPEPSIRWNERSSPLLATCRPWKPKCL